MRQGELDCPPPDPQPRPPHCKVPAGATDCHAHVIGPASRYPFVPSRSYTPPDASLPDYLHVLRTLGLRRAVLVQPSMHGADNTAMMNAIGEARGVDLRAVVVVRPDVGEAELAALHERGARGVRINVLYAGGNVGLSAAAEMAARIRDFGWHLQVLADVSQIGGGLARLSALPVPVVFDHFGHLPAERGVADKGFEALLELVRRGNVWVKLSAPYRLAREELPYADVRAFYEALMRANPERMLWGTDWPHTVCRLRMPNDGDLLDLICEWLGDERLIAKVLAENPAELYGFAPP